MGNSIIEMQADKGEFIADPAVTSNIIPFVKRCTVCPNSGRKVLEFSNGEEEIWDYNNDNGQEY